MGHNPTIEFAPVGSTLNNGFDLGGDRIYPFSTGLAITPPTEYSSYIGPANGIPIAPPTAAQAGTTGVANDSMLAKAMSHPFGKDSPLPWIILGLIGAVVATHVIHYKD